MIQNVLNLDPTRTTMLRKRFMADMSRRFILLLREIIKLVVDEDAFGLKLPKGFTFNEAGVCLFGEQLHDDQLLLLNAKQQWRFRTDDQKVAAFRAWLQEQIDEKILTVEGEGDPWLATYIHSGYRQGVIRAWLDVRPDKLTEPAGFAAGSKAQFLSESFAQPEALSKLKLLATRSFEELKGVTTQMGANMNRVLSDGIAHGKNPRAIARDLSKQVGVSRKRALVIARTEIIHAHSEGQLDSFERLGVDELGVMVEWSTAGDSRVCKACQSMSGKTFTVKEARGMIPKHPNCRCAFIPSLNNNKILESRAGSQASEIEAVMGDRPMSTAEIQQASGLPQTRVARHLRVEQRRGTVQKTPEGWVMVSKQTPVPTPVVKTPITPPKPPIAPKITSPTVTPAAKDFGSIAKVKKYLKSEFKMSITINDKAPGALKYVQEVANSAIHMKEKFEGVQKIVDATLNPQVTRVVPHSTMVTPGGKKASGWYDIYKNMIVMDESLPVRNVAPTMGTWVVGNDASYVFRHEFGHRYWYRSLDKDLRVEWTQSIYRSKRPDEWKHLVSQYGASLDEELYAESFSAYTSPNYVPGSLPEKIESFMERTLKPKVGS